MGIWSLLIVGYLAVAIAVIIAVLRHRKDPTVMLAWILAAVAAPYLSGVLYLLFGENRVRRRARRRRRRITDRVVHLTQLVREQTGHVHVEARPRVPAHLAPVEQVGRRMADMPVTSDNEITLFDDADRTFASMEAAIRSATHHIHMEYYIWQADETGRHFRDLLIERAKDGVECRLLVDSFGSFHLNRRFLAPLRQAGVKFEFFGRLARFRPVWLGHLRNHRKIVVVDGQTSYIGSQNIGDEYRGRHERLKPWFDCQLRIRGPATLLLQHTFAEDWYVATGEALGADGYFPIPVRDGASLVQILPTGPDQDVMLMEQLLFTAISTAQKSINIATAYFIPSSVVRMALVYATMRGVKVRLVVPSLTDSILALWAGRSFYDELVEAGVRVCEIGRGMMHSKIITIDDRWGMVGSVNMDIRSFRLNFEVTAIVYEEGAARELASIIDRFCAEATDITLEHCRRRPINEQLKMGLARLLSPLL